LTERGPKPSIPQQAQIALENPRPLTDEDLQVALKSLRTSTDAIDEQVKQLELQKQALLKLKSDSTVANPKSKAKEAFQRKQEKEQRHLETRADQLSEELQDDFLSAETEAQRCDSVLVPFVNETFASDDRLLNSLSKLLPRLQTSLHDGDRLEQVERWCKAIVAFRTTEMKARTDDIYALTNSDAQHRQPVNGEQSELEQEKQALQTELESLKSEVSSVLAMVVDHELRKPIFRAIQGSEGQAGQSQREWLVYVCINSWEREYIS
jgi:hypothetical protein